MPTEPFQLALSRSPVANFAPKRRHLVTDRSSGLVKATLYVSYPLGLLAARAICRDCCGMRGTRFSSDSIIRGRQTRWAVGIMRMAHTKRNG
jgi:hypothetical protein